MVNLWRGQSLYIAIVDTICVSYILINTNMYMHVWGLFTNSLACASTVLTSTVMSLSRVLLFRDTVSPILTSVNPLSPSGIWNKVWETVKLAPVIYTCTQQVNSSICLKQWAIATTLKSLKCSDTWTFNLKNLQLFCSIANNIVLISGVDFHFNKIMLK